MSDLHPTPVHVVAAGCGARALLPPRAPGGAGGSFRSQGRGGQQPPGGSPRRGSIAGGLLWRNSSPSPAARDPNKSHENGSDPQVRR